MANLAFKCLILLACVLLNCHAFAVDKSELGGGEGGEQMKNDINKDAAAAPAPSSVISKMGATRELRMPSMDEIMTVMAAQLKNDAMPSDEPSKVITYKDFCEVLGTYQVNREKNHYDHQGSATDNKQTAKH